MSYPFSAIICRLKGHNFRRMRKAEKRVHGPGKKICGRCGETIEVKARKVAA